MYQNGVKKTVISKELSVNVTTLTRWGLRKKKVKTVHTIIR